MTLIALDSAHPNSLQHETIEFFVTLIREFIPHVKLSDFMDSARPNSQQHVTIKFCIHVKLNPNFDFDK